MNETQQILDGLINDFSTDQLCRFFREKSRKFVKQKENYSQYNDDYFKAGIKLGEIKFSDTESLLVCSFVVKGELSERAGKRAQYEKAKSILKSTKNQIHAAGIFIFSDQGGNFRFSLVYPESTGTQRQWNNFRRFTYFVSREFTNKTFLKQIGGGDFDRLDNIKAAFSITAVTDLFYNEFFKIYDKTVKETQKINKISNPEMVRDFILLFCIRTIFIGFIQKRRWLGDNERFIQHFWGEYQKQSFGKNRFYARWLTPLFFEALNSPQGRKVSYGNNDFSKETELNLQMAPYLNGGLFKIKRGYDDNDWIIPDKEIKEFFDFLFAHSFTIEENSLEDEDLQLNPEFLGIIFERLVNKADGAVYTPRTEVDLMCRLSLVKWLQKNLENPIRTENLYELFFKESAQEDDQKVGSFSRKEAQEILTKLENLAICDLAVGSGAFLVGMMQVLDDVEQSLKHRYGLNGKDLFERKKQIIKDSLYGVEVKEWAVWICQLRLWLSLFVDAPDELKNSLEPILPSLDFKVRQGDSLVQRVGSKAFPVSGHNMGLSKALKDKITKLKSLKLQYFDNKSDLNDWELRQRELAIYKEILDTEISDKIIELRNLKNIKPAKTLSLFGERDGGAQVELELNKDKIAILEREMSDLEEQKNALHKDKPLVWSIEFADVFGEKDGFDIIIGNPPYVRQEDIADPTGRVKDKKEYKNYLQEMVKIDFPNDFPPKLKINAQSDLYTYFYIRGLRLLNPSGIHTFICSNSWLDVAYGVWLQDFLLKRCQIELIIDNHAKRSFGAADVNTIISIIHAPQKKIDDNGLIKFVAFKKPFEESVFTENLRSIENAQNVTSNDVFRVYPIATNDLRESGTEFTNEDQKNLGGKYVGDKWGGKYLRAPNIFFTVLEKGKNKYKRLVDIAEVSRGFTTGINEFFYLLDAQAKEWKIEEAFLRPVIKSPRECKSILVNPDNLKYKVFVCNKSKKDLKGTNALKYIEWGEKQKTKDGVFWKDVPSVSGRKYWWSLSVGYGNTFWTKEVNDRLAVYLTEKQVLADCRLYYGTYNEQVRFFLNSTIYSLLSETMTRSGLGLGARSLMVYEVNSSLCIPLDANVINKAAFESLLTRENKSIFVECGINPKLATPIEAQEPKPLPDRAALDKIVFDMLGLGVEERKDVYRAVCRLVWNRLSKAESV
ncbi:hypothetical protein GYA19_01835 [Candidatus Beckwithbacteria bacterium]|nr:hypothetical protein [Candidatus Beckwithbacteria bacterium]